MATKRTSSKASSASAADSAAQNLALLQSTVMHALEKIKAGNIQVFDTTELSALFEQVIIASGSSNRQTKALAASVRDAVRQAGLPKPRIEGEENGEWIIVDCGQVVVHIMQPAIRQYYQLEDLWGEKPIEIISKAAQHAAEKALKKAAASKNTAKVPDAVAVSEGKTKAKPASKAAGKATAKATSKTVAKASAPKAEKAAVKNTEKVTAAKKSPAKKVAVKKVTTTPRTSDTPAKPKA